MKRLNVFWKARPKKPNAIKTITPDIVNPTRDVSQFTTNYMNLGEVHIGRAWKPNELRIKSNEDLHTLWHVLYKEQMAITSDMYYASQVKNYDSYKALRTCLVKVKSSMGRLKTVLEERDRLRSEFLLFLEYWYVRQHKDALNAFRMSDIGKPYRNNDVTYDMETDSYNILLHDGKLINLVLSATEIQTAERKKVITNIRQAKLEQAIKPRVARIKLLEGKVESPKAVERKKDETGESLEIKETKDKIRKEKREKKDQVKTEGNSNENKLKAVKVLNKKEVWIANNLAKRYDNDSLLKNYIANHMSIKTKQRRIIISEIRAARAKQGKKIVMKELAAIAYRLSAIKKNDSTQNQVDQAINKTIEETQNI